MGISSRLMGMVSVTLLLAGCGSGGGGSSAATGAPDDAVMAAKSTQYSVSVVTPDELDLSHVQQSSRFAAQVWSDWWLGVANAAVHADLQESQFQFARVNSAGVVTEIFRPLAWGREVDGTYRIELPGEQRVDMVIAVRLDNQTALQVGHFLPDGVLLSPLTDPLIDIDLASTVAYQNFLQLVDDHLDLSTESGFDTLQLQTLINRLQESMRPNIQTGQSLAELVKLLKVEAAPLFYRQARQISEAKTGNLAVLVSEQGASWFAADDGGAQTQWLQGTFQFDTDTQLTLQQEEAWDGLQFQVLDALERQDFLLTPSGWVQGTGLEFGVQRATQEGGLLLSSSVMPALTVTLSAMEVSLSGELVSNYFFGEQTLQPWLDYAAPSAHFSEQAMGYELNWTYNQDHYWMWSWSCDVTEQVGRLCNQVPHWDGDGQEQNDGVAQTLSEIISSIAASTTDASRINVIKLPFGEQVAVELVLDGSANLYRFDWSATPASAQLLGTASWLETYVHGQRVIELDISSALLRSFGLPVQAGALTLTEYQGYVRYGDHAVAGTQMRGDWVFNQVARQDILGQTLMPCSLQNSTEDSLDALQAPNSIEDFKQAVSACNSMAGFGGFSYQDLAHKSFQTPTGEQIIFSADGTGQILSLQSASVLSWQVDHDGYLEVILPDEQETQLLAMVGMDAEGHIKIKGLTRHEQQSSGQIWSDVLFLLNP